MRLVYFLTALAILFNTCLFAGSNNELRDAINNKFKNLKAEDFIKLQTPKKESQLKNDFILERMKKASDNRKTTLQVNEPLPSKFRTPAEFEEVQAVLISWPSYAFDADTNMLEVFTPGIGYYQDEKTGQWNESPIAFQLLDLFDDSPYPTLWAALVDGIQPEATCWIRVAVPADTVNLKIYLQSLGITLYNYKFITDPNGENAYWMRDFGPFGIYYGEGDTLGLVNAQYYPGRPIDNDFPMYYANQIGVKIWNTDVETEGGNFIADGHDNIFYSSVIYGNNADAYGKANTPKTPMSSTEVDNQLKQYFSAKRSTILPQLNCDGGTGHVDLYLKMIDDETFMIANFPDEFKTPQFQDYYIMNNNRSTLANLKSFNNGQYRFVNIPVPTLDNGTYGKINCKNFNSDARNYINGLTVNKTFLMPIYSDLSSGNRVGDSIAIEYMKKEMNGYKIYPIDVRVLSPLGGAIHCVTMQIPAENPVFFSHKKYSGMIDAANMPTFLNFQAKIQNHSGIKEAKIFWRKNSEEPLNMHDLQDIDGIFTANIDVSDFVQGDSIKYYIVALTNNGKTAYYPITAPEGNFTGYFGMLTSVTEINDIANSFDIKGIYPNPVNDFAEVKFEINNPGIIEISIINSIGDNVMNLFKSYLNQGTFSAPIDVNNLSNGIYLVVLKSKNEMKYKKLIINK